MGRAIVGDASSERKLPRQAMTMILAEPRKIPFKWTQTANAWQKWQVDPELRAIASQVDWVDISFGARRSTNLLGWRDESE